MRIRFLGDLSGMRQLYVTSGGVVWSAPRHKGCFDQDRCQLHAASVWVVGSALRRVELTREDHGLIK